MRPNLALPFSLIRTHATKAIDLARDANAIGDFPDCAANWGSLRVVQAEFYETDSGTTGWRVLIEEASPEAAALQIFVRDYLREQHLYDVEVVTAW